MRLLSIYPSINFVFSTESGFCLERMRVVGRGEGMRVRRSDETESDKAKSNALNSVVCSQ